MTRLTPRRAILAIAAAAVLVIGGIATGIPSSAATMDPAAGHDAGQPAAHQHDGTHHHDDGTPLTALPPNDPARGLVYDGYRIPGDGPCKGLLELKAIPGACTHGPDAPFPGLDVKRPVPPVQSGGIQTQSVVCEGDGQSGYRVHVLYIHGSSNADRYSQYLSSIRGWSSGADDIYNNSAAQTGGTRHIRFVTDSGCQITVADVSIANSALSDFGNSVNAIKAQGYNRTDRKYLMFVDATALCGVAYVFSDSQAGQSNANNSGPSYSRVDSGCWNSATATHELTHSMGSVMNNSPNHTSYGHCTDDYDIMCYNDGPGTVLRVVCTDRAQDNLLDCNDDDYFSTNPAAGSYLATHWNTANNRFLISGGSSGGVGAITGPGGKCVDVNGSNSANGTAVQIWTCNSTAAQSWTIGSDGTLRALGKCLDVSGNGTANGTKIIIWTCSGGGNQVWRVSGSALVNPQSNRCLDLPGGNTTNGTQLQIWDCNGTAAQTFRLPS